MDNSNKNTRILTLKEVAVYLKLNERTVLKMARVGNIPAVKIARQWRFKEEQINEWFDAQIPSLSENHLSQIAHPEGSEIYLHELIREDLIQLNLTGNTVIDVLKEMVELLTVGNYLKRPGMFLNALFDREKIIPTAVGRGIAVPHPRHPMSGLFEEDLLVIGVSEDGIDWSAADRKPVHLAFLICTTSDILHLRILSRIMLLVHKKGFDTLRKSDNITKTNLIEKIKAIETRVSKGKRLSSS